MAVLSLRSVSFAHHDATAGSAQIGGIHCPARGIGGIHCPARGIGGIH
jgi:hypothetical protein